MYIDIHVLQTVPPSNLNRDDAGSPKQATYGGVRRARVSSQAWKRATRRHFHEGTPEVDQSTRTKRITALVADRLVSRTGLDQTAADRLAEHLLTPLGITPSKKTKKKGDGSEGPANTAYLLFFGLGQLDRIVDLVADRAAELVAIEDDKQLDEELKGLPVEAELQTSHPVDVALFGRMVADLPRLNVDAAAQVAHAISTHPVEIEFDYYTAVDDEKTKDDAADAGAEMIGTVEFNSATLYRYATVGLEQLVENLGGDREAAVEAVDRFIDGFARSMPTGHQNSFAHRTRPSTVVVVVRDDQPVNLVSAFEVPIWSRSGLVGASTQALAREVAMARSAWGDEPRLVAALYDLPEDAGRADELANAFGPALAFPEVLSAVRTSVAAANGSPS